MSVLGTGVAAGVAQTALQAQQVAQRRDRRHAAASDARHVRELFEVHLRALEEGDEHNTSGQARINPDLPQHQSPQDQDQDQDKNDAQRPDAEANANTPASESPESIPPSAPIKSPLYRHLDVKA